MPVPVVAPSIARFSSASGTSTDAIPSTVRTPADAVPVGATSRSTPDSRLTSHVTGLPSWTSTDSGLASHVTGLSPWASTDAGLASHVTGLSPWTSTDSGLASHVTGLSPWSAADAGLTGHVTGLPSWTSTDSWLTSHSTRLPSWSTSDGSGRCLPAAHGSPLWPGNASTRDAASAGGNAGSRHAGRRSAETLARAAAPETAAGHASSETAAWRASPEAAAAEAAAPASAETTTASTESGAAPSEAASSTSDTCTPTGASASSASSFARIKRQRQRGEHESQNPNRGYVPESLEMSSREFNHGRTSMIGGATSLATNGGQDELVAQLHSINRLHT